jgi:hypothetical protein
MPLPGGTAGDSLLNVGFLVAGCNCAEAQTQFQQIWGWVPALAGANRETSYDRVQGLRLRTCQAASLPSLQASPVSQVWSWPLT